MLASLKKRISLWIPIICPALSLAVSMVALVGWIVESELLIKFIPSSTAIQFESALIQILLSSALILQYRKYIRSSISLAVICLSLLFLTTVGLISGGLLSGLQVEFAQSNLHNLAVDTTLALALISISIVLTNINQSVQFYFISGLISVIVGTLGLLAIFGYTINLEITFDSNKYSRMSLVTAINLVALSLTPIYQAQLKLREQKLIYRVWQHSLIIVCGILATFGLWISAVRNEKVHAEQKFERDSKLQIINLQNNLDNEISFLLSLQLFFENSLEVSRKEFNNYVSHLHHYSALEEIAWAPLVTVNELSQFERSSGLELQKHKDAKLYLPVLYAAKNDKLHGLDIYANSKAQILLNNIFNSKKSEIDKGEYFDKFFENKESRSANFYIFLPILKENRIQGILIGRLNILKVLLHSVTNVSDLDFNFKIDSTFSENKTKPLLFCSAWNPDCAVNQSGMEKSFEVSALNKQLDITVTPSKKYLESENTHLPESILAFAIFVTLVTYTIILFIEREKLFVKAREARLRLHLEKVKDYAIYTMDPQGIITSWNEGAQINKGYEASEVIGKNFSIFYLQADIEAGKPLMALKRALAEGHFEDEGLRIRKDGSTFWAAITVTPILDDADVLQGFTKITRDRTDAKNASDTLREKNEMLEKLKIKAEQATSAKSQFLANMSHEIRTPLTSIIGFTVESLNRSFSKDELITNQKAILRNAKHLLKLINEILDLSKIEAGKLEIKTEQVELYRILYDVYTNLSPRAEQKGIKFSLSSKFPLPMTIYSDATRIRQIIFNLVDNAIKFTKEGSIQIDIACNFKAKNLQITVSDSGIGISDEQLKTLFTSFSQGHASIAANYGGTGLGLFISKQLTIKLGGNLIAKSTLGKGSIFIVSIPTGDLDGIEILNSAPAISHFDDHSPYVPEIFRGKVLLAEDVPDTQRLLKSILTQHGIEVEVASDGKEVLEKASERTFDLIFMDMQMPIVDGIQATKHLRDNGYYAPVVALTANMMGNKVQECIEAGCDGCLGKPIERKALSRILSLYLAKHPENVSEKDDLDLASNDFITLFSRRIYELELALGANNFQALAKMSHRLAGAAAFAYRELHEELVLLENAATSSPNECSTILGLIRSHHIALSNTLL